MTQYELALKIATEAHEGQVDKQGEPYLGHLLRVAAKVPAHLRPAALLHDTLEDTTLRAADLLALGVAPATVATVQVLTRQPGEVYAAYIVRVKAHPDAVVVKLADLTDNTDPARCPPASLLRRYQRALEELA